MGNIIEHDGDEGDVVVVGGNEQNTQISLKAYQDLYHQITGKSEEIRQTYKEPLCIEFGDLEQLHHKISQLSDVHNVVAGSETITLYCDKERKETFTSFERFRAYNTNSTASVKSVVLKYNFSIVPAKLKRPQEYSITIKLVSRISILKELHDDVPSFMSGALVALMTSDVAEVRVEYVDYVVARGYVEAFDEWVKGCKKSEETPLLKFAKRRSHLIPPIGKILISILYGYFIYMSIDSVLGSNPDFILFCKFLILSSVIFVVAHNASSVAFKLVENFIDSFSTTSYIKLNKGDERQIEMHGRRNRKTFIGFVLSGLMAIALGVVASQISGLIDKLT